MAEGADLYERIVDAANGIYGAHPRSRALHAKGFFCEGSFVAGPEAAALTRAVHMQGERIPLLVRFSTGGGDPSGHDGGREARGMAIKFRLPDGQATDLLGVTTPLFIARTPEDFLEILELRKPDPETGQPDMEKLGAYLQGHPEALPGVQATIGTPPPASYAQLAYNSLHAFRLVDVAGGETWVRYRIEPEAGEATISDEEARAREADYLRLEMEQRLASGPAAFELQLIVAEPGDPVEDPTAPWPEERSRVPAGRIEVERLVADPEENGEIVVFDPVNVIDGIELPDDPILHARSRAYSVSAARRA
jgi:catalase